MKSAGMKAAGMRGGHRLYLAMALALGVASQAQAIGLGAIQVKSQLGKPFVAEIPITLSMPNEADDLSVRLASSEAFARVGLERPNDLSANLQFTIGKNARGEPVVRVSTPQPMTDPYVSFLLEADWGRGKMVREYTALLDPPRTTVVRQVPIMAPVVRSTPMASPVVTPPMPAMMSPAVSTPGRPVAMKPAPPTPMAAVAPVAEPMEMPPPIPAPSPSAAMPAPFAAAPAMPEPPPASAAPESEPAPVAAAPENVASPEPAASAPEAETAAPAKSAKPDTYTVARGDTLAHIADGVHGEVSLNRMMIALQRANPDAFIDQNINLLKSGSVLRIPPREEAQTLTAEEANLLVQQQVESWRQSTRPSLQPAAETGVIARPADNSAQAGSEPRPEPAKPAVPHAPRTKPAIAKNAVAKPAVAKNAVAKPDVDQSVPDAAATGAAAKPAAKPAVTRVARAHLEIVPPVGSAARGSQTGASEGGKGSELRVELAQTSEDLAARKAEVGELKSRVAALEKMQQDNQSLISMKDSKLAAMQQRLADLEKNAAATPAGSPVLPAGASTSLPPQLSLTAPAPPVPTAAATSTAASAPAPSVAVAAKPIALQPAASIAETPWYQRPLVLIGGVLLLLGGLLGLMLRGHRPNEAVRVSRYSSGTLAASLASVRAEAAAGSPDAVTPEGAASDAAVADSIDAGSTAVGIPAADVARNVPTPAAGSASVVRRPYWTGNEDVGQKAQKAGEPAAAGPVQSPVASSEPMVGAASGPCRDDWALDSAPAAAAAITKQSRATPALEGGDQDVATKMELARAYIDIGDAEGARGMLEEVLMEGSDSQREDALKLLETLD